MKKSFFAVLALAFFIFGCASVQVKAPKEPIKVDISMRLDVYQHVENDINDIESMVSGAGAPSGLQSFLPFGTECAYAQEGFGADVGAAVAGRKSRYQEIARLEAAGTLGENKGGLLEARSSSSADGGVLNIVSQENKDRMVIYRSIAEKNGTAVGDVQKMYAERLQKDAPAGTPIEVVNKSSGKASWQVK